MIKGFTVINPKGEELYLELRYPERSGLIVESITGLGAENADIMMTDIVTTDFALFTGARRPVRNIVITLRMMFDPLIEDARLKTYKYFPIKKQIKLIFHMDRRTAEIVGYVESNTPDIFSKEENTQISILCPDPNFYIAGSEFQLFSGVQPRFEFPFSHECVTTGNNAIRNWDFKAPFNSLGYDGYSGNTYTIDHWKIWNGGDRVYIYYGRGVEVGYRTRWFYYVTKREDLANRSFVLSFLTEDGELWSHRFTMDNRDGTVYAPANAKYTMDAFLGPEFNGISITPSSDTIFVAAKLEYGPEQTLAVPIEGGAGKYKLVTDEYNLLEFGEILQDDRITFEYDGDADTGMLITVHMMGGADDITIWNVDTREKIVLDSYRINQITGGVLDIGDDILISTMPGDKYVKLLRKGKYYNIIGALGRNSDWPQVTNGKNTYTFTAKKGDENVLIIFSYKTAYSGI